MTKSVILITACNELMAAENTSTEINGTDTIVKNMALNNDS